MIEMAEVRVRLAELEKPAILQTKRHRAIYELPKLRLGLP